MRHSQVFVLYIDTDALNSNNPKAKALYESAVEKWKEEFSDTFGPLLILPKCSSLDVLKVEPKKTPINREFDFK